MTSLLSWDKTEFEYWLQGLGDKPCGWPARQMKCPLAEWQASRGIRVAISAKSYRVMDPYDGLSEGELPLWAQYVVAEVDRFPLDLHRPRMPASEVLRILSRDQVRRT